MENNNIRNITFNWYVEEGDKIDRRKQIYEASKKRNGTFKI